MKKFGTFGYIDQGAHITAEFPTVNRCSVHTENVTYKVNSCCFKLLLAYSIYFVYFVKCWQMFLELNSKRLHQSSGKEKESCCLVYSSSAKFRNFYVVVVQQRQRNVEKKRDARAKLFLLI